MAKLSRQDVRSLLDRLPLVSDPILKELGITQDNDYTYCGDNLRGKSICHSGDNPTGFSFYHNSGTWACWTKQCHLEYGNNLVGLVMAVKGFNAKQSIRFIVEILQKCNFQVPTEIEAPKSKAITRKEIEAIWHSHINQKSYPDILLNHLMSASLYAQRRNFDENLFRQHGIGMARRGGLVRRIVVPVRNALGSIVGFTGRDPYYQKNVSVVPKWKHWPAKTDDGKSGFNKDLNFFNFENVLQSEEYKKHKSVILVEGPFDVIKLEMAGIHNVMAVLGNMITGNQVELLKYCNFTEITLALDQDKAGRLGAERIARKLEKSLFRLHIILAKEGSDWGEMTIEEIQMAVKNRRQL